jgi:hypothetical protein
MLFVVTFILSLCMHIQNNITSVTYCCYTPHPVINKFYLLTCLHDSLMYEKACP